MVINFANSSFSLLTMEMFAGLLCLWMLSIIVYRCRFHPLARFPGPWYAKISDFYMAYQSLKGRSHLAAHAAHQQWGPVVRLGPNKLSFNSIAALHQIYYSRHVQKAKSYAATTLTRGAPSNTFNCIDKPHHRRKRKIVNQAFSEQALRGVEPMVLKHVNTFIRGLVESSSSPEEWSKPRDLTPLANFFTLDVVGEFGFGQSFDMLSKPDNRYISKIMAGPQVVVGVYYQYPGLSSLRIDRLIGMLGAGASAASVQQFTTLVRNMVVNRMSKGKDAVHDLFSYIVDAKDPETGEGISIDEIWVESRLFLVAGSDTTAAALAAAFFYLARHPRCYEKVVREIRTEFPSGDEIRGGPQLSQCRYLRACIDETMRMSPPVAAPLWREITAPDGLVIDGTWVPQGTNVGMSTYAMHHNEEIFPDSYSYAPDRWLTENTTLATLEEMKKAYNPFSLGARRCVAKPMAYMELTLALAKTLWYMDMRSPEGPLKDIGGGTPNGEGGRHRNDEFQMYEHFISRHHGPFLQFRYRKGVNELAQNA